MARNSIADYSKTQRIVLLIDLNPLLHLRDPSPYLTTLISATKTVLSFPPLSSSLFAFKLFFSSLSPLLSSSKLSRLPLSSHSLCFDLPEPTLISLSRTLETLEKSALGSPSSTVPSRGCHVAASMRQLVHDYAWDTVVRDPVIGTVLGCHGRDSACVSSNLVVLFSPVLRDLNLLAEFLDMGISDELLPDLDSFKLKFRDIFASVDELFSRRDIHMSWVDVKYESGSGSEMSKVAESSFKLRVFESGIRDLRWGFCSTDSIILGSAVVPFGLIYPAIVIPSHLLSSDGVCMKFHAQITLELLDVNGKPLECKWSELELVKLKIFSRNSHNDIMNSQTRDTKQHNGSIFDQFNEGITKLRIRAVKVYDDTVKLKGCIRDTVIMREISREPSQDQEDCISEFYADRVLQVLAKEAGTFVMNKTMPLWQILLSFLCEEGYSALVSLSHESGSSYEGILEPFTFSSALLSIVDNESRNKVREAYGSKLVPLITNPINEMNGGDAYARLSSSAVDPKPISSSYSGGSLTRGNKRTPNKKRLHSLRDLTWSAFVKSALDCIEIGLADAYFARFNSLKKLKFLKCWMKQIKKSSGCSLAVTESLEPFQESRIETNERVDEFPPESDQKIPLSASEEDNSLSRALRAQEKNEPVSDTEPPDSFFSSLPNKIQQGLESEEVDGGALAERLVNICIFCLNQKFEKENESGSETSVPKSEGSYNIRVVEELTELLLKEPKELFAMHKKNDSFLKAPDSISVEDLSKIIVREYELQIFFRMGILRSECGAGIEESIKQKFVKHICLFLEAIQRRLDSGFFGEWSLEKYVSTIIKSRYNDTLGDIVNRICTKMDLLLISDEDESTNSFLNSEDSSSHSGREKKGIETPIPAKDEDLHTKKTKNENRKGRKDFEPGRLLEAQERRERARRFASFTSWMPDLQRVWAPKQPKAMKSKSEPARKLAKRKERQGTGCDMVCETPLSGYKRSCGRDYKEQGRQSVGAVPKALFQDDKTQKPE